MGLRIEKYNSALKTNWDSFIDTAKNSHFFFKRDYMEYHADRFEDFSLLFWNENDLVAILAANIKDHTLYSHQGLSFGGFIVDNKMRTQTMVEIFDLLKNFLQEQKISKLIYKAMPRIYHQYPCEEDLYALTKNGAKIYRRDCSSTILLDAPIAYQERRKRSIKKAIKANIKANLSDNYAGYWQVLESVLMQKYSRKPVHSLEEIQKLVTLFNANMKLFTAEAENGEILAGTLIYENPTVLHAQYLGSSDQGKELGALDLVIDCVLQHYGSSKKYFDFGISTEDEGKFLNIGLVDHKEGFGARATVNDFYELPLLENSTEAN